MDDWADQEAAEIMRMIATAVLAGLTDTAHKYVAIKLREVHNRGRIDGCNLLYERTIAAAGAVS